MPESVSGVDAILNGLREKALELDDSYGYTQDRGRGRIPWEDCAVALAAAVAAVHAAADARTPPARVVARWFHEEYERLAPDYGYRTREASAVPWDEVPEANRDLMIATAENVLRRFPNGGTHDEG